MPFNWVKIRVQIWVVISCVGCSPSLLSAPGSSQLEPALEVKLCSFSHALWIFFENLIDVIGLKLGPNLSSVPCAGCSPRPAFPACSSSLLSAPCSSQLEPALEVKLCSFSHAFMNLLWKLDWCNWFKIGSKSKYCSVRSLLSKPALSSELHSTCDLRSRVNCVPSVVHWWTFFDHSMV